MGKVHIALYPAVRALAPVIYNGYIMRLIATDMVVFYKV